MIGTFWLPEKNGKVEISREGDRYSGHIVAPDRSEALDENNPDPDKRDRRLLGIRMFADFEWNADRAP